jgi:hypothetical protein
MVVIYRLMFWGIIKTVEKVKPIFKALGARPPKYSQQSIEKYSWYNALA